MGFSVMDKDGNVTSKTVFWGGMPIDVMTITRVEDLDPDDTSVMVMTEKMGSDGVNTVTMTHLEMGSHDLACNVHERASAHAKTNSTRV